MEKRGKTMEQLIWAPFQLPRPPCPRWQIKETFARTTSLCFIGSFGWERKRGQGAGIASWIDEVAAGHSRRHTKSISCFALSKSIWVWLTCQSCSHKNRTENSQQNFVRWKRTNKQNFNRIIVGVSLVQCGQGGTRLGLQLLRKRKLCGASVFCYLGISCVCMCVSFIRSNKSKIYIQTHTHW